MSDGGRRALLAIEHDVNNLLDAVEDYEKVMQELLNRYEKGDPFHKLANLQLKRVGWIQDLLSQTEEIVRDMFDRTQNVVTAEKGRFV